MRRTWTLTNGNHVSYIEERRDGQWIAGYGLKPILDPYGTSGKQDLFETVEKALAFVGYPLDFVPIPESLR
jgi:hypothetical protein